MKKRFQVIEVVRQTYQYEVEANSPEEAENNVRRGIFNSNREMDSKKSIQSYPLDATYTAREIW
jgi:hypothetical protein